MVPADKVTILVYDQNMKMSSFAANKIFVRSLQTHIRSNKYVTESGIDIALVYTRYEFEVTYANLARNTSLYPSGNCTIAGFGLKGPSDQNAGSPVLTKMYVKLLTEESCLHITNTENLLCLLQFNGVGPCIGDSGSPLICDGRIEGVLSRGVFSNYKHCGSPINFGVFLYERVSHNMDWINDIITNNGNVARFTVNVLFLVMSTCILYFLN